MKKFKLTPKWVLNNLPLSYNIIDEEVAMVTDIELDFVFLQRALKTLGIQYHVFENEIDDVTYYGIMMSIKDISQVSYQKQRELQQNKLIIRRGFKRLPDSEAILTALTILSWGLRAEISKINNEKYHIGEILNSLSEFDILKCKFFLDSDGKLRYNYEDQTKEFTQSDECELINMFGEFACFQINLGYFELRNPKWKGMNKTLEKKFPEIYNAYIELSKKFGFTGTARLIPNLFNCDKYFGNKCLWNPDIENWEINLLEFDENYSDDEKKKSVVV